MPELPEVETIKKGLCTKIIGLKLAEVIVENRKSFPGNEKTIIGKKVIDVSRRAKIVRIHLDSGESLIIHLKMTGQLIFVDKTTRIAGGHPSHDWHDKLPNKYTRVTLIFENGSKLFFNDLRKFGWIKLLPNSEVEVIFEEYGPEPFSKEFTTNYLRKRAERIPERTVKQFIMDQKIIAGVGNIYADESLFLAKIMPRTRVRFLTDKNWEDLVSSILKILEMGIKYGGTTDSDYVDSEGKKGGMQDHLNVYHKTGQKCLTACGGEIERIVIGGRGTNYCPKCQKEAI